MEKTIPLNNPRERTVLLPVDFPDGKWGYINDRGEVVIEPRFERTRSFEEGLAVVKYRGKYGAINQKGEFVIEPSFFDLLGPSDGLLLFARKENRYGYMDLKGNIVIKPQFDTAYPFHEGRALVRLRKWKNVYRFFNTEAIFAALTGAVFLNYNTPFYVEYRRIPWREILKRKKLPIIFKRADYAFINKHGGIIIKGEFLPPDALSFLFLRFSEGYAPLLIYQKHEKDRLIPPKSPRAYYIDKEGEFVLGPYQDANLFSEGYAYVKIGDYYGIKKKKGDLVHEPYFNYDPLKMQFSNGLIPVMIDVKRGYLLSEVPLDISENPHRYKWGYLDKYFQLAIPPVFDEAEPFSEGLAAVRIGDKWGYIDTMGRWVIRPKFDKAFEFLDGIAEGVLKDTLVYFNRQGEIIWPPEGEILPN